MKYYKLKQNIRVRSMTEDYVIIVFNTGFPIKIPRSDFDKLFEEV